MHEELYDMTADSAERTNIADAHPDIMATMRTILEEYRARCPEQRSDREKAAQGWKFLTETERQILFEERAEALKSIGYVQESAPEKPGTPATDSAEEKQEQLKSLGYL